MTRGLGRWRPGAQPDEDHDPDGLGGDEEGGEARIHLLLGPDDAAVADEEQEAAGDEGRAPVDELGARRSAQARPAVKKGAGG